MNEPHISHPRTPQEIFPASLFGKEEVAQTDDLQQILAKEARYRDRIEEGRSEKPQLKESSLSHVRLPEPHPHEDIEPGRKKLLVDMLMALYALMVMYSKIHEQESKNFIRQLESQLDLAKDQAEKQKGIGRQKLIAGFAGAVGLVSTGAMMGLAKMYRNSPITKAQQAHKDTFSTIEQQKNALQDMTKGARGHAAGVEQHLAQLQVEDNAQIRSALGDIPDLAKNRSQQLDKYIELRDQEVRLERSVNDHSARIEYLQGKAHMSDKDLELLTKARTELAADRNALDAVRGEIEPRKEAYMESQRQLTRGIESRQHQLETLRDMPANSTLRGDFDGLLQGRSQGVNMLALDRAYETRLTQIQEMKGPQAEANKAVWAAEEKKAETPKYDDAILYQQGFAGKLMEGVTGLNTADLEAALHKIAAYLQLARQEGDSAYQTRAAGGEQAIQDTVRVVQGLQEYYRTLKFSPETPA